MRGVGAVVGAILFAVAVSVAPSVAAGPQGEAAGAAAGAGGRPSPRGKGPKAAGKPGRGPKDGAARPRGGKRGPRAVSPAVGPRDGDRGANAAIANGFLKEGKTYAAVMAFRRQLARDPESVALNIGLGKALQRAGECPEALDRLQPYVGLPAFGLEAAMSASACAGELGLWSDAVLYDRVALEEDPDHVRALTALALDADASGDAAGVAEALARLDALGTSGFVRAAFALRHGDLDLFDVELVLLARGGHASATDVARMTAQSWLDVDDPVRAVEVVNRHFRLGRSRAPLRMLRGEAYRRRGETDIGRHTYSEARGSAPEGALAAALHARVLVDDGAPEDAAQLLRPYASSTDPEVMASRWYVARALGDTAAEARAAAEYAAAQPSPLRRLELLVPVTRR